MKLFENKYKILEKIGGGSCGEVYKAIHVLKGELCAIKIEPKNNLNLLCREAQFYIYLQNMGNYPSLRSVGKTPECNYIVLDLLDKSLENVQNEQNTFSIKTTLLLGIQMIQLLDTIHKNKIIHRDLKPSNFMFGIKDGHNCLYLIDFGLCIYDENGHIYKDKNKSFVGNYKYTSFEVMKYGNYLYRDDVVSSIYIMLELYMGKLPWYDIEYSSEIKKEYIQLKDPKNVLAWCDKKIPHHFMKMIRYVLNSKDEFLNYGYMIRLIKKELN